MTIVAPRPRLWQGRWLLATCAVVLMWLVLVRLGFWQLERLSERRAANAALLARLESPPLTIDGTDLEPAQVDLRRAEVRGTFDFANEVWLRNQARDGAPGVHLITPLKISGSDRQILVDRGWAPLGNGQPIPPGLVRPSGEQIVDGVVRKSQSRLNGLSPADPPLTAERPRLSEWFRVDIPRIQEQTPGQLLSVYLQSGDPLATAQAGDLPRPDFQFDLSDGPHLSYAFQWFAFSATLLVGYLFYFRHQLHA